MASIELREQIRGTGKLLGFLARTGLSLMRRLIRACKVRSRCREWSRVLHTNRARGELHRHRRQRAP